MVVSARRLSSPDLIPPDPRMFYDVEVRSTKGADGDPPGRQAA